MRRKNSIIWKIEKSAFTKVISTNDSISGVLRHFGLPTKGASYKTVWARIHKEQINTDHIRKGVGANKGRICLKPKKPLTEVLTRNSSYQTNVLKKRLLSSNLLENKCVKCGLGDTWQGEKLCLVLDHINGDNNDNRIENLRILCPNCHSQTPTFAGRRHKKRYNCQKCGKQIGKDSFQRGSQLCRKCTNNSQRKVPNRPTKIQLNEDIETLGYCGTGRKYGVSDNCIRKWMRYAG